MRDIHERESMKAAASRRVRLLSGLGIVLVLAACLGAIGWKHDEIGRIPRAAATRKDLTVTVRACGVVESAVRTVVRCQVQNVRGKKSATTVLTLTHEGTVVKAGDVLCRLDASDYEELERRQRIGVSQARADHRRAELDVEAATTALNELRGGYYRLRKQELEGRMALTRAQVTQCTDRLEWSRRMLARGYASRAQVASETSLLEKAAFAQAQAERESRGFEAYEFPRAVLERRYQVESARSDLLYQAARLRREEERLTDLRRQVDECTIRAPHGGVLLYAHKPKRGVRIEEGMAVHQNQELFYLPDLSRMEVQVLLHETVVARVRPGMRARIRLEGCGDAFEGTIAVIDPLPITDRSPISSGEVRNYLGRIPIESGSGSLRPGTTAEVEIAGDTRRNALVIPAEAPHRDRGRDVCFVLGPDGFEARTVDLGWAEGAWQEVADGIFEGEEVALSAVPPTAFRPATRGTGRSGSASPEEEETWK
jgi:HlyD family secretion protein